MAIGKELKAQTDTAKKHYQKSDDTFEFDKIIKKGGKPTFKKFNRSSLIGFCLYYNSKRFNSLSLTSKYPFLFWFYSRVLEGRKMGIMAKSSFLT